MWVLSDRLQFCPIAQGGVLPVPPSRRPRRIERRTLGRSVGALKIRPSRGTQEGRRFWGARSPASNCPPLYSLSQTFPRKRLVARACAPRARGRASRARDHAHSEVRRSGRRRRRVARWRARALPVEARGTPEGRMRDHGCRLVLGWDSGASSRQITRSEPRSVGRLRKFRKWAERPPRFLPLTHAERNFIQEFGSGQPAAGPNSSWQEID